MHSYSKGRVNVFSIYRWILTLSFILSLILGAIKYKNLKNLFDIFNLIFAGMPFFIMYVIYFIFIKYAWKWSFINKFINVPNINGVYEGILKSSFDNFQKEHKFKLKINQDFENISIIMEMLEKTSKSYSINAFLEKRNNEIYLIYNYQNEPIDKTSPTLTEHKGTTIIKFSSDLKTFEGNYFTDKRPVDNKTAKCNYGILKGRRTNYAT